MALLAMRKNAGRLITQIFLLFIILSFLVWGVNFNLVTDQQSQTIASVGDIEINSQEYIRAVINTTETFLQNQGISNIEIDEIKQLRIPQNVINNMVNQALIENLVNDSELDVTDEYLQTQIKQNPALQTDGSFNPAIFAQTLRANNLTQEEYLQIIKKEILAKQYVNSFINQIENKKIFQDILKKFLYDSINIEYITINKNDIKTELQAITIAQIQQYYQNNQNQFFENEYRKIGFVKIDQQDLKTLPEITQEEINNFYQANQNRYKFDEEREIEQIVFSDKNKAQIAYQKLKNGQDFYQTAKNAGFTKQQLNIGIKTKKQILDKKLAKAAFNLQKNQFSMPTEINFGTAIIKVTKIIPAKIYTLNDEYNRIKNEINDNRNRQALTEDINQFEQAREQNNSIKDIAEKLGYQYNDTLFVNEIGNDRQNQPLNNDYITSNVLKYAFETDIGVENDFSDLSDGGALWFDVINIRKRQIKPLNEVQKQIEKMLEQQQIDTSIENIATEITDHFQKNLQMDEIAKKYDKSITAINNLSRAKSGNRIPTSIFDQMFKTKENRFGKYLQKKRNLIYIYKVIKRNKYQQSNIEQQQNKIIENYSVISQQELITTLLNNIRKKYPVTINQEAIEKALQSLS